MGTRAEKLHLEAVGQIDKLVGLSEGWDDADLRRPCPGREKLGDGSVGSLLAHTTDNYLRIAAFLGGDAPATEGDHRPSHHDPTEAADPDALRHRLVRARVELGRIAELDDLRLDSIPPEGAFRFCDGKRSLEEVLTGLLTHQGHQVDALARS